MRNSRGTASACVQSKDLPSVYRVYELFQSIKLRIILLILCSNHHLYDLLAAILTLTLSFIHRLVSRNSKKNSNKNETTVAR